MLVLFLYLDKMVSVLPLDNVALGLVSCTLWAARVSFLYPYIFWCCKLKWVLDSGMFWGAMQENQTIFAVLVIMCRNTFIDFRMSNQIASPGSKLMGI